MQNEEKNLDDEILDYLYEFGNTREADLIKVLTDEGFGKRTIKKHLRELDKKKKIFPVYHTRLRPIGVYYSINEEHVPLEIQKEFVRARAQVQAAELQAYSGR